MTPRRGALALAAAVLLTGCGHPAPSGSAHQPVVGAAAVLGAARSVMTRLHSYAFVFTERTVSPEVTTTVTGRGEVASGGRLFATFSTGGGSITVLQTATVSYVKLGTAPWRRDPTLALHAVRWTQLLAGVHQVSVSAAAAGGHVVSGVLDAAAIAGLGLSLGGQGHQPSNVGVRLVMHLDGADRVTQFVASLSREPAGTATGGASAPALGVQSQSVTLVLSEFDTAPPVPSSPPSG